MFSCRAETRKLVRCRSLRILEQVPGLAPGGQSLPCLFLADGLVEKWEGSGEGEPLKTARCCGGGVEDSEESRREVTASESVCGQEPATSGGDHCVLGGVYDPSPT